MSVELATMLPGETAKSAAEGSAPAVVRDAQWVETALTVLVTSVVVILVSVLAVAMNLT
jgi:hypothetical protein